MEYPQFSIREVFSSKHGWPYGDEVIPVEVKDDNQAIITVKGLTILAQDCHITDDDKVIVQGVGSLMAYLGLLKLLDRELLARVSAETKGTCFFSAVEDEKDKDSESLLLRSKFLIAPGTSLRSTIQTFLIRIGFLRVVAGFFVERVVKEGFPPDLMMELMGVDFDQTEAHILFCQEMISQGANLP